MFQGRKTMLEETQIVPTITRIPGHKKELKIFTLKIRLSLQKILTLCNRKKNV